MGIRTFLEALLKKIENFKPVLPSLNKSQKLMKSERTQQSFVRNNRNKPSTNRYLNKLQENAHLLKHDQDHDRISLAAHSTDTMGRNHSSKNTQKLKS